MICVTLTIFAITKTPIYKKEINLIVSEDTPKPKRNLKFVYVLVVVLIIATSYTYFSKQNIEEMTIEDLKSIEGIGQEKAEIIYTYVRQYNFTSISDLVLLEGIGEVTVKELKKHAK